ncbi:hypothetical protein NC652_014826 [Populus alba x Populus x berolinensis]|nr:hypothetical protein NC652_014826 [Populus alba x Populus x berolinensis]
MKINLDERVRLHYIDNFERRNVASRVGFCFPKSYLSSVEADAKKGTICCIPPSSPLSNLNSHNWFSSTTSNHLPCT